MVNDVLAGRYRLEEPIATGGMGTVWRARDEVLQRSVAVKMLHESLADDPAASERFRREALTAASMSHPHMANVFDYVEEGGRPGIVMELVEGETLAQRIARDGRLPVGEAVRITVDVLTALEAAHDAGIIHRDVKPGNILIMPNGRVKVGDFGIARSIADSSLTVTGTVMGTAHYSAPEQVRGEFATPATDLYSVGVVLYEMLTGSKPFQAETQIAVAMARLERDPEPPRALRESIPPSLDAVVMRALARDTQHRFATAVEMRDALLETTGTITAIDHPATAAIPVSAAATTLAYSPVGASAPAPAGVAEVIPPRWAARRLMVVLLPLLLIGLAAFWIVAAMRGTEEAPDTPAAASQPTRRAPVVAACCKVPSLKGLTLADAEDKLIAAKLVLGDARRAYSSTVPRNRIISTSPTPGKVVAKGTEVDYVVSLGPAPRPDDDDKDDDDNDRGKGKGKRNSSLRGKPLLDT